MKLIEQLPLREIHFLNTFTLKEIKQYYSSCKNETERKQHLDNLKSFCQTNIKNNGSVTRTYSYSLTKSLSSGGRLYSGNSVQSLSKAVRGFLMKHTTDIDMKNAHPVILKYICDKHKKRCPMLTEYIQNRDEILNEFGDREEGKTAYLCAINDNKSNKKIKNRSFIQFDDEMKILQKEICSLPEYQCIKSSVPDDKKYNWNGSALNRILCMYENQILQSCISALEKRSLNIQVLMFDGLMIDGNHYSDSELLNYITNYVNNEFIGLNMEWAYKQHSNNIQMPDDFQIPDKIDRLYAQNDLDACELVFEKIKDDIVFCKGTLYYKKNHIWINDEHVIFEMLVSYIQNLRIYMKTDRDDVEYSHKFKSARDITHSLIGKVKSNMDNNWLKRSHSSSLGKILFNNGYFNFKTEKFYTFDDNEFDKSIIFTGKIHHDFEVFDIDYMNDIQQRIFYNTLGQSVGDFLILNLARGLAGDMMKRVLVGLGGTNTGKSVLTDSVANSFGDYFGSFNAENLAYRNTSSDEAQTMRWAMLLKNKRVIMSNEIKSTTDLNGNMLKKISSGGDTLIGRNHCQSEEEFIMQPLAICLANDFPNIKPYDDAVEERLRVVSYIKQYVDEPTNEFELKKDEKVKDEVKTLEYQKAFIGLLIREYILMKQNGLQPEPLEVIKAKQDWINSDKSVIDSFKNDFEMTDLESDYVTSKQIEEWVKSKNLGITMKKFGMEMQKYIIINKLQNIKNDIKKIKGKVHRVWFGIKFLVEVEDDNEC